MDKHYLLLILTTWILIRYNSVGSIEDTGYPNWVPSWGTYLGSQHVQKSVETEASVVSPS